MQSSEWPSEELGWIPSVLIQGTTRKEAKGTSVPFTSTNKAYVLIHIPWNFPSNLLTINISIFLTMIKSQNKSNFWWPYIDTKACLSHHGAQHSFQICLQAQDYLENSKNNIHQNGWCTSDSSCSFGKLVPLSCLCFLTLPTLGKEGKYCLPHKESI